MAADPRPANDSAPIRPSLFDRAVDAARRERAPAPEPAARGIPRAPIDRAAALLALSIVATPLVTLAGAALLTVRVRGEAAVLAERAAPIVADRNARQRARALLASAWHQPTLGTTIEAVARTLPPDAALLRAERGPAGAVSVELLAPDPDRVLAALRRDPVLAALRATAQARADGDGRMRITLEQR
ncbi:hypothetical protein [Sphingomonas hankookensis]|uniref:Uncharacterized protein n=1 Tax=Sphingomonas hengshuiensis TaxID=1609977 RepID=A0A2W4YYD4_9SPHN|nr:MAG: hypothetical protein DI632_13255 [Sphingomonas hengshuiensis]